MSNVLTEIDGQYPYITKNEKKIADPVQFTSKGD